MRNAITKHAQTRPLRMFNRNHTARANAITKNFPARHSTDRDQQPNINRRSSQTREQEARNWWEWSRPFFPRHNSRHKSHRPRPANTRRLLSNTDSKTTAAKKNRCVAKSEMQTKCEQGSNTQRRMQPKNRNQR
jgi:hypothetical protein